MCEIGLPEYMTDFAQQVIHTVESEREQHLEVNSR